MVFGLISLAATVPLLATSTVLLQDQARKEGGGNGGQVDTVEDPDKTKKCHFAVRASSRMDAKWKQRLEGVKVVLRDGAVFLSKHPGDLHEVTSYLLPFPNTNYEGVVTTIDAMNMLNWIYVRSTDYRVVYGVRAEAERELTGPVGLLRARGDEKRLTFEGWEGFVAVKSSEDEWVTGAEGELELYFDKDDDGLKSKMDKKREVGEVELVRVGIE